MPQAVALYRKACDGGDLTACNNLGNEYDRGRGVTLDKAQAVALYRKACDGAVPVGCDNLGGMYEEGRGVALDAGRAVSSFRNPLRQRGFLKAAHGWGLACMKGKGQGVAPDKIASSRSALSGRPATAAETG